MTDLTHAAWFKSSYSNNSGGACVEAALLTDAPWFKSSHSNDHGGNCVEAARLTGAEEWFKSTRSNDHGGECVEGAHLPNGAIAIRDSKDPHGPTLIFPAPAWTAFTTALRTGTLPAEPALSPLLMS